VRIEDEVNQKNTIARIKADEERIEQIEKSATPDTIVTRKDSRIPTDSSLISDLQEYITKKIINKYHHNSLFLFSLKLYRNEIALAR
jgi:hypothetical protein